jgi:hypothetical protein
MLVRVRLKAQEKTGPGLICTSVLVDREKVLAKVGGLEEDLTELGTNTEVLGEESLLSTDAVVVSCACLRPKALPTTCGGREASAPKTNRGEGDHAEKGWEMRNVTESIFVRPGLDASGLCTADVVATGGWRDKEVRKVLSITGITVICLKPDEWGHDVADRSQSANGVATAERLHGPPAEGSTYATVDHSDTDDTEADTSHLAVKLGNWSLCLNFGYREKDGKDEQHIAACSLTRCVGH